MFFVVCLFVCLSLACCAACLGDYDDGDHSFFVFRFVCCYIFVSLSHYVACIVPLISFAVVTSFDEDDDGAATTYLLFIYVLIFSSSLHSPFALPHSCHHLSYV